MARPSGPVRTASPVTRQLFMQLRASKTSETALARKAGISVSTIQNWRIGTVDASIFRIETAFLALGYELTIRRISPDKSNEDPE